MEAGHSYFVPPGVRFSGHVRVAVRHSYIHFDILGAPPLLFPAFQSQLNQPLEIPCFLASQALQKLAEEIWTPDLNHPIAFPDMPTTLRAKSLLFAAFAACVETWPAAPTGDLTQVRPALEHIESHLHTSLTNTKLASLCHFSSDHFIVRFRAAVGQTPGQYLLERRLAVAAQKLLFSPENVESIASQTGFCDRFHFSRAFKTRYGLSPVAYRKNRPV
jgi:AraC-like DNA-binding protein